MLKLDIRHLSTLQTIRDTGSIAKAAQRLHLTQSALSHQLHAMEAQIGEELFARKSRPLRFSASGQRLLQLADEVLPRYAAAENDIRRLVSGEKGRLHIVIECHSCFDWLLPTMDSYREQWPEVEMDLSLAYSLDPLPALVNRDIDLVITSDPIDDRSILFEPLFRYQSLLVMANDHPLTTKQFIEPQDLQKETLITYPVDRARLDVYRHLLEPAGIEPAQTRTAELTSIILQLVASQRGVSVLPGWAIEKYLQEDYVNARPLGKNGIWSTLYAAIRKEQAKLPYISEFIETAKKISFATLPGIAAV
jgi:LysR family transcriptional regulator for metE and metH